MSTIDVLPVMLHALSEEREPNGHAATRGDFRIMNRVHGASRRAIDPNAVLRGNLSEPSWFPSFDDGLYAHWSLGLDWLAEAGLTGAFFIHTMPLEEGYDVLIAAKAFQQEAFEDDTAFYAAYEAVARTELNVEAIAPPPPEFLAEFGFYSDADRRHRYIRDVLLDHDCHRRVTSDLMRVLGRDWKDYGDQALWLDEAKIRDIRDRGHAVGLHTHTHPTNLERMDEAGQRREFTRNKEILENILGEPVRLAAYPCGRHDARTKVILEDLGVEAAFISRPVASSADRFAVPRIDIAAFRNVGA